MYFGVFLIHSKQNLLIPFKWIFGLNVNYVLNNGIDSSEEYLVFYSKCALKNANFLAPIRKEFDSEDKNGACYHANIFKIFDDNDKFVRDFIVRRRHIAPINYKDLSKRLLSYISVDDNLAEIASDYSDAQQEQICVLQKAVDIAHAHLKVQEGLFNEKEKREIQRIVLNDDDDEVFIYIPLSLPLIDVKIEPDSSPQSSKGNDIQQNVDQNGINQDYVSGQMSFEIDINGFRVFKHGFKLSPDVVNELSKMNSHYPLNTSMFDEAYIQKLIDNTDIRGNPIRCLIKDIFNVRAEGDADRLKRFDIIVKKMIASDDDD